MSKRSIALGVLSAAVLAASLIPAKTARATEPEPITAEAKAAFDTRMFTVAPAAKGKTYACFVRRYDASHLAGHPDQKVTAMKLLVTAEWLDEDKTFMRSFRLGVKFHDKRGDYDSSGGCNHVTMEEANGEVRLGCGVDCDGGGIGIAIKDDNKSTVVRLTRVRIWQHGKESDDESAIGELVAGKDDNAFRLERTSIDDCRSLVTDRKELAELRRKK